MNHHGVEVEAVESMEMAPGVNPRPGRVPEQELLTPETCLDDGGGDRTFRGRRLDYLGFLRRRQFIGIQQTQHRLHHMDLNHVRQLMRSLY